MTVPFMVMLSESETSQRFFGTCVPQNDREVTLGMTVLKVMLLHRCLTGRRKIN